MEFSGNLRRHQNTSTASKGFSPQNSAKGPRPKQAILFIHSTNIPPKNSSNQPMSAMNKRNVPNKNHPAYFTHMLLFFKRNKKKTTIKFQKKNLHKTQLTHQKTKNLRISKLTQRNLSQGPPASTRSNTMVPALHASARKSKNSSGVFDAVRNPAVQVTTTTTTRAEIEAFVP